MTFKAAKFINNQASLNTLIIPLLLILIPLLESLHSATLWGLRWHSPLMMDKLSNYLLFIKLISVVIGMYLCLRWSRANASIIKHKLLSTLFNLLLCALSAIQIGLLLLGILLIDFGLSLTDKHQEKSYNSGTIYLLTADPGALGSAYHYLYFKCSSPLGFYELKLIDSLDWIRQFDFYIEQNQLTVTSADKTITEYDLSNDEVCKGVAVSSH